MISILFIGSEYLWSLTFLKFKSDLHYATTNILITTCCDVQLCPRVLLSEDVETSRGFLVLTLFHNNHKATGAEVSDQWKEQDPKHPDRGRKKYSFFLQMLSRWCFSPCFLWCWTPFVRFTCTQEGYPSCTENRSIPSEKQLLICLLGAAASCGDSLL